MDADYLTLPDTKSTKANTNDNASGASAAITQYNKVKKQKRMSTFEHHATELRELEIHIRKRVPTPYASQLKGRKAVFEAIEGGVSNRFIEPTPKELHILYHMMHVDRLFDTKKTMVLWVLLAWRKDPTFASVLQYRPRPGTRIVVKQVGRFRHTDLEELQQPSSSPPADDTKSSKTIVLNILDAWFRPWKSIGYVVISTSGLKVEKLKAPKTRKKKIVERAKKKMKIELNVTESEPLVE